MRIIRNPRHCTACIAAPQTAPNIATPIGRSSALSPRSDRVARKGDSAHARKGNNSSLLDCTSRGLWERDPNTFYIVRESAAISANCPQHHNQQPGQRHRRRSIQRLDNRNWGYNPLLIQRHRPSCRTLRQFFQRLGIRNSCIEHRRHVGRLLLGFRFIATSANRNCETEHHHQSGRVTLRM